MNVSLSQCTYSVLDTAISTKTTAFAGVPWVLKGFTKALKNESDEGRKAHIIKTIKSFKVFGVAGASTSAECIKWAKRVDLPVVHDFGMKLEVRLILLLDINRLLIT